MNELLKIDYADERPTVSGRSLHEALEVETPYHKWFPRMCEYGFIEKTDYTVTDIFVRNQNGGKQTRIDHQLTIPMAKEIAMLQRTEKGKEVRQYFIQIEQNWNRPEMVLARANKIQAQMLEETNKKVFLLEAENAKMKPKVQFADAIGQADNCISVGEMAKILCQNGFKTGQRRLFDMLSKEGYIMRNPQGRYIPQQKAMNLGLMRIKETLMVFQNEAFTVPTIQVTPKGQQYFINRYVIRPSQIMIQKFSGQ